MAYCVSLTRACIIGGLLCLASPPALACGPWWPDSSLYHDPESPVLRDFDTILIRHIKAHVQVSEQHVDEDDCSRQLPTGTPCSALYEQAREELKKLNQWSKNDRYGFSPKAVRYLEAIVHSKDPSRHDYLVTALYMLGRVQKDKSDYWFEECRKAASKGFPDLGGLAAASYGWQAKGHIDNNPAQALNLYLKHLASGDLGAAWSISYVLRRVTEDQMPSLAADPLLRNVVNLYLATRKGSNSKLSARKWITCLEQLKAQADDTSIHLAWGAYHQGEYALTEQLLSRSSPSFLHHWLQAKIHLRNGKMTEALACYIRAEQMLESDSSLGVELVYTWHSGHHGDRGIMQEQLRAELGLLQLNARYYTDALTTWIQSGDVESASYIAERVLTLEELEKYVSALPEPPKPEDAVQIGNFLARRLARAGRWEDALPLYASNQTRKHAQRYIELTQNENETSDELQRAEYLWQTAVLIREHGMELMGCLIGPDNMFFGGGNFRSHTAKRRRQKAFEQSKYAPSRNEVQRAYQHIPSPNKRFHYRYFAADLAWESCSLLEDNHPELATRLSLAGRWLFPKDPKASDRFYQSLIKRCPGHSLALRARKVQHVVKPKGENP